MLVLVYFIKFDDLGSPREYNKQLYYLSQFIDPRSKQDKSWLHNIKSPHPNREKSGVNQFTALLFKLTEYQFDTTWTKY